MALSRTTHTIKELAAHLNAKDASEHVKHLVTRDRRVNPSWHKDCGGTCTRCKAIVTANHKAAA